MEKAANKVKLGIFVLTGTILLIVSLYLIGTKQNIFNKTLSIYVRFNNVNGLIAGNNVRFAGITIGTINEVTIESDTAVLVEMVIREDAMRYIRKKSIAEIGSDGLMGNKLINVSTLDANSPFVVENDIKVRNAITACRASNKLDFSDALIGYAGAHRGLTTYTFDKKESNPILGPNWHKSCISRQTSKIMTRFRFYTYMLRRNCL